MRKSTRSFALSAASAALVLAAVTGCGQARPEGQSESTVIQTEAVPAVTEAPIVIQTEAPQTEPETQPQTQAQTQAPETQAPETQAPETQAQTQAPEPVALSEEEELNQLYEFADDEIGTRFANADMNVRQGPTTEGDNIISSLDKGEEVTVIGETANWYEIYKAEDTVTGMTDLKGFVMKRYTSDTYDDAMAAQPDETTPSAPEQAAEPEAQNVEAQPVEAQPAEEAAPAEPAIVQENSAPASQASGPQVTVTSDANIRSDAYETATVVGVINAGTAVTQIGSADGWVQVDYNGVQGYIKSSMVG